jgi:D-ribose pyranase
VKDRGILHPRLARVIASMGLATRSALLMPACPSRPAFSESTWRLHRVSPAFLDVLDAVLSELRVERYTMAKESSPHIVDALRMRLRQAKESSVTHEELKQIAAEARVVVRTGEFRPFANVILYSGVDFTPE